MKGCFILSLVSLLGALVVANELAGPYQAILIYQAYMIEYNSPIDPSKRQIAPKCVGSSGGACSLDELLRYLDPRNSGWRGTTGLTFAATYDVDSAANALANAQYKGYVDAPTLAPDKFSTNAGVKFHDQYGEVIDSMVQANSVTTNKDANAMAAITKSTKRIVEARMKDKDTWKAINDGIDAKAGFTTSKTTHDTGSSRLGTYEEVRAGSQPTEKRAAVSAAIDGFMQDMQAAGKDDLARHCVAVKSAQNLLEHVLRKC